jgi:hypothetical protein
MYADILVELKCLLEYLWFFFFVPDHASLGCRKCFTNTETEKYTSLSTQIWVSWSWDNGIRDCEEPP